MQFENKKSDFIQTQHTVDIPILSFHQVGASSKTQHPSIYIDLKNFEARLRWMSAQGYRFISLSEAVDMIKGVRVYERKTAAVTFDDGYEGVYSQAFGILKKYRCRAAIFLIANTFEAPQSTSYPFLKSSQVREMTAWGMEIGVHSFSHADLTKIAPEKMLQEIRNAKDKVEQACGTKAEHFCYPYGKSNASIEEHVRDAGYKSACSTLFGRKHRSGELFNLKRISVPYGQNWLQFFYRLEIMGRK